MAPRLSGQNSIFGVVFFVSKSLLGIERQKKLEKFAILTRKPRSHARILIYRTWPIRGLRHRGNMAALPLARAHESRQLRRLTIKQGNHRTIVDFLSMFNLSVKLKPFK